MSQLTLHLLGPPQIELNGYPLAINRRKVLALLAYLASSNRAHPRDHLATLLWPGYNQSSARANLRKTVSLLNQYLDKRWLDIQREQIGLLRSDNFWLDSEQFRKLIDNCTSRGQPADEVSPFCLDSLNQAAELYRDNFLSGFSLPDSPEFTDWQLFQSENYRRELAQLFETLSRGYANQKEWEPAVEAARRWLSLDPLEESAHRQLMRLMTLKGQRNAALVQYEQCRQILAEELEVEPAAETIALFEEIKRGELSQAKAPTPTLSPPSSTPRFNLPPQLTTFVGRQDDVVEIIHLLREEPACRHVTLFGPGGAGKTRLAIKAATDAAVSFSEGVTFVPLVSLNRPDSLIPTIIDALDLNLSHGQSREPRELLFNYLRQKELLLILDNFEHLISQSGTDLLSDILLSAPRVKLLVTSRQRLNLQQEWSVEVSGMSLPPADEQALPAIEKFEAVQLFLQRARRVQRDFSVSVENRVDIVRICQLVGGMPLGIELAAAWLRLISCREIVQEIERSLDFLTSPHPDMPQRHHSLRAVFESSWKLLNEEEQVLLRRLSIIKGSSGYRAAQRVAGATLPLLTALVDKAMLRRTRSGRYQMHELLRQFAAEKLDEFPHEKEQTQELHLEYYLTFIRQRGDKWQEHPKFGRFIDSVADSDNVWTACYHAISHGKFGLLANAAWGVHQLSQSSNRLEEGANVFQQAIESVPETAGDSIIGKLLWGHGAISKYVTLIQSTELLKKSILHLKLAGAASERDLAYALQSLAESCWLQGLYSETQQYARESLSLFTKFHYRFGKARAIQHLGYVATYRGEYEEGIKHLEESKNILQEEGLTRELSQTFLGIIARLRGKYEKAKQLLEENLPTSLDKTFFLDTPFSLRELAYVNISLGKYQVAEAQMEIALEMLKEIGRTTSSMFPLTGLGFIARLMGEYEKAERLHREGLALSREVGERRGVALCLENLGRLAYDKGEYANAERLFLESLEGFKEISHPHGQATVLCQLAITTLSSGSTRHAEAEQRLYEAFKISKRIGSTPLTLEILTGFTLLFTTRDPDRSSQEKSISLLAHVLNHPASEQETKDKAQRLWDMLSAEAPAEWMTSAMNRGRQATTETFITEVVEQRPLSSSPN